MLIWMLMKHKIFKVILLIFGCFLGSCLVFRIINHQSIDTIVADYPRAIKKLHVNLPDIADVYSSYNRYGGVSGVKWSGHKITFTTPLSERTIKQLERKVQRRWNKWYRVSQQKDMLYIYARRKETYFYQCTIIDDLEGDNDCLYIEYCIDEE